MSLMTIDEITAMMQMRREYVRDRLVKRPDFPRPALSISQKSRRWNARDVQDWIAKQSAQIAR